MLWVSVAVGNRSFRVCTTYNKFNENGKSVAHMFYEIYYYSFHFFTHRECICVRFAKGLFVSGYLYVRKLPLDPLLGLRVLSFPEL